MTREKVAIVYPFLEIYTFFQKQYTTNIYCTKSQVLLLSLVFTILLCLQKAPVSLKL